MTDNIDLQQDNSSEVERLKSELARLQSQLEHQNNIQSILFTNLSHEIRTPLNGILGFSEMLTLDELSDEERIHYSKTVLESGNLLLDLIVDVTDIVKLNVNQIKSHPVDFDLNDLIYDVFEEYQNKAEIQKLDIYLDNLISEPFHIKSDPIILKRILQKLLDNAIKFTKDGWVKIGYIIDADIIQFYIEDTGIGIDDSLIKNLFERFIKEDVSSSRKIGGTGIDLTLCSGLCKCIGGKIWYEKRADNGSVFRFTFQNHTSNL